MNRTLALLLTILLLPSVVTAAGAQGYRLAGVLAVGPDYLAILELPGGGQVLVRKGSTVAGGGQVVLLEASRLRIAFPGRQAVDVSLDGSGAAPQVPVALGVVQEQSDEDHVMIRQVDPAVFDEAVNRSSRDPAAASRAARTGGKKDAGLETALRLAPILNLPPNSRVVTVNEQPVQSAEQAIRTIQRTFDEGMPPRLNLVNDGGEFRVYLKVPEG
jgi:hypothetical protein